MWPLLPHVFTQRHNTSFGNFYFQTVLGKLVGQSVMRHRKQHTAPLACICRKSSLSIKQRDTITRESAESEASCGSGCSVQERRSEMKARDFLYSCD